MVLCIHNIFQYKGLKLKILVLSFCSVRGDNLHFHLTAYMPVSMENVQ